MTQGYYKRPELNQTVFDSEGFFHSGDIAQWLPNGTLQIIDRKKDLVKLAQVLTTFSWSLCMGSQLSTARTVFVSCFLSVLRIQLWSCLVACVVSVSVGLLCNGVPRDMCRSKQQLCPALACSARLLELLAAKVISDMVATSSQGEYVSPERVEGKCITSVPVGAMYCHGESLYAHLVAVVCIDAEALPGWVKGQPALPQDLTTVQAMTENQVLTVVAGNDSSKTRAFYRIPILFL